MNIHTIEIAHPLGPKMMRAFCRSQRWFQFNKNGRNHAWSNMIDFLNAEERELATCLESELYPVDGIQKATLLRNPSLSGYFYFVVIVNLEALYRQDVTVESFGAFTSERLQRCACAFSSVMAANSAEVKYKPFLEWSTRRVDYTVDVKVPGLASLYVELAKRSRIPRGMEHRVVYDGSYYLKSIHDDVTINFYDKLNQLVNDRYLSADDRLRREAQDLLRFEVQCQGRKLDHIRNLIRRRGLPHHGMKLRTFLNEDIANSIVQDYYARSIGYLDYHDLSSATTVIKSLPGRKDCKERVMRFLRQVEAAGSVEAAITAYRAGRMADGSAAFIAGPESSLQNIMNKYLQRYELNPVLIPAEYRRSLLPNSMPTWLRNR